MDISLLKQYNDFTRYVRPVKPIQYSEKEMLQSLLHYLEPDEIASVSQLLGDRKGVIRITFKTRAGVKKMEEMVSKRKLCIQTVPLGRTDEYGQFIMVILENIPQFVTDDQVEDSMAQYGTVAGSSRDFVEYKGRRIENERRRVLFTTLKDKVSIPREMKMFGTIVYTKLKGVDAGDHDVKKGLFDGVQSSSEHQDPDLELLARQQKDAVRNNKQNKRF